MILQQAFILGQQSFPGFPGTQSLPDETFSAETWGVSGKQGQLAILAHSHSAAWLLSRACFGEGKAHHLESLFDACVPRKMGLGTQSRSNTG